MSYVEIEPRLYSKYLAQLTKDAKVGLEIGTWIGGSARAMLKANKELYLYCIDPYGVDEGYNSGIEGHDLFGTDRICFYKDEKIADKVYKRAKRRLWWYRKRHELMRVKSHQAVGKFSDGSLDFVYVDGNHNYDAVRQDIQDWWPKVKEGGLLFGHDLEKSFVTPFSVMRAVMECFGSDFMQLSNFWIVRKNGRKLRDGRFEGWNEGKSMEECLACV